MARTLSPIPATDSFTLQFLGDTHVPLTASYRRNRIKQDIQFGRVPTPAYRFQVGDLSHESGVVNAGADDTTSVAFMNGLLPAVPWTMCVGNHDVYQGNRTALAALAAYGQPNTLTQVLEFAKCKVLVVSPDGMSGTNFAAITLSSATLQWLDDQLAASTKDCIIVCHAPLKNTVTDPLVASNGGTMFDSAVDEFWVRSQGQADDTLIRAMLAARPKARAWICGHTHNDPRFATAMYTTVSLGGRSMAHINLPSPSYTTPQVEDRDPMWTGYLSITASGVWEFRLRNHGYCQWDHYKGQNGVILLP